MCEDTITHEQTHACIEILIEKIFKWIKTKSTNKPLGNTKQKQNKSRQQLDSNLLWTMMLRVTLQLLSALWSVLKWSSTENGIWNECQCRYYKHRFHTLNAQFSDAVIPQNVVIKHLYQRCVHMEAGYYLFTVQKIHIGTKKYWVIDNQHSCDLWPTSDTSAGLLF